MSKISVKNFQNNLINSFKKIKINKNKNIFITGNLKQIAHLRIPKNTKVKAIYQNMKKLIGPQLSIFVPTATLNLCNNNELFDLEKTPGYKMGPFSEYIRKKNSIRSLHPFWSISGIGKKKKILKNVSKHAYGYGSPWSKMLENDFFQVNVGTHPSRAVTLIHHIETIIGVPYRYNKKFIKQIKINSKVYEDEFYQSVFFKNADIKKRILLNEHFFEKLKKQKKLFYCKNKDGLELWSFKMKDFFKVATEMLTEDMYCYLETVPDLTKIHNY